jgi:PAS domain S-box-containing protein
VSGPDDLFQQICEAAPDGIIVVDKDGCVVLANAQVEKMFGFERAAVIGAPVEQLLPVPAREAHVGLRSGYLAHPSTRPMGSGRHLLAQRKDGTEFPVEISLSPVRAGSDTRIVAIVRDISDRRRLEAEREHLQAIAEREQERQRIAMTLHDGVIQSIYAAALSLEMAAEDVKDKPDEAVTEINRAIDQLNDTIRDLRVYILDLRPARYGGDLGESLRGLATEFRANTLIEVSAAFQEDLPRMSESQEAAVFHVVQEALNNVRKHSRATQLTLRVSATDRVLEVDVIDDGVGFDPNVPLDESSQGMRNMLSRASSTGGLLRVETAPGSGTRVHIELPVDAERGAQ